MTLSVFTLITLGLSQQINSILRNLGEKSKKRAFSRVGAKIWNEMPASLRELSKKHFQTKFHSFLLDILKKHDDYTDISQFTSALKNVQLKLSSSFKHTL